VFLITDFILKRGGGFQWYITTSACSAAASIRSGWRQGVKTVIVYTVILHPLHCLEELIIHYKAQLPFTLPFTFIVFPIVWPAFWFVFSVSVCVGNLVRNCLVLWVLFTCLISVTLYCCFRNSELGRVFFETLLLFIKLVLSIIFPVTELLYFEVKFSLCLL